MLDWVSGNLALCQAITSVMMAILSVAAIFVSVMTYRAQRRLHIESVRPLLSFEVVDLPHRVCVKLRNDGPGVAKVSSARFIDRCGDGAEQQTLLAGVEGVAKRSGGAEAELLNPTGRSLWKQYLGACQTLAVAPNGARILLEMELPKGNNGEKRPGLPDEQTLDLVRKCLIPLTAEICYTDIHGHEQEPLTESFGYVEERSPYYFYCLHHQPQTGGEERAHTRKHHRHD